MELKASISIIIVSVVVLLIVVLLIVLVAMLRKGGGKAQTTVSDGKRSFSFGMECGKQGADDESAPLVKKQKKKRIRRQPEPVIEECEESESYDDDDKPHHNTINDIQNNQSLELIRSKLTKTHNFFTHTAKQYTKTFHGFSLYNRVCAKNIKHDSEEVMEFKKLIAGKYLHECLFKYFCDMLEKWILSMEEECIDRLKTDPSDDSIPTSYYSCLEPFMNYKEEASKLARNITFTFAGKTIHGIPDEFVDVLNDMSMKNVNVVNSSLNIILYTVTDRWIEKVKEILDMYILVFGLILNDVDATLIILNGEMKAYVENLMKT